MSLSSEEKVSCELIHHGAAASSCSHALVWIPTAHSGKKESMVVYSSHGIVNVALPQTAHLASGVQDSIWNVQQTLRTNTVGQPQSSKRIITSLTHVRPVNASESTVCLACGFSDGTVNTWCKDENDDSWNEQVFVEPPATESDARAITDIDGLLLSEKRVMIVTCTSDGARLLTEESEQKLASFAANAVRLERMPFDKIMILVGTAHPRHNKIHVYTAGMDGIGVVHHCGHLSGHQDWITSFDWHIDETPMLASASQDAKIRLWLFSTTATTKTQSGPEQADVMPTLSDDDVSDDLDLSDADDDDDDEGEARLEIVHESSVTSVTLEALLLGHEEAVTCVKWHPSPMQYYGHPHILISSSMDRTLLIWSPSTDGGGVWTPLTRVGSAGGILGGSVGSSLLGFVNCAVEPSLGNQLLGHAYGGALHFWSLESHDEDSPGSVSIDEMASRNKWKATPCITGHFEGVTDMCWEAGSGDYLLTVSLDQTCRLWGPVHAAVTGRDVWVELARPQVHGYDINAISSVSTMDHKHLIVSGADEKELRVFDAPLTSLRTLRAVYGEDVCKDEEGENITPKRVERAYIPSLGLSNKATAGDGAEEDAGGGDGNDGEREWEGDPEKLVNLPLERDLGVISLWPEVRKLFGHNTELFCLASTVSARSGQKFAKSPFAGDVLVASSAKARDVKDASIRIWDVDKGKCKQVLAGGHRSTVAAMSFSPDGRYLASSGKDRRLCLWRRNRSPDEAGLTDASAVPPLFSLAAAIDSAHKRIVWSVHFCPHDPTILASGSRDGCIKIWKVVESLESTAEGDEVQLQELFSFEPTTRIGKKADSVTALAIAPAPLQFAGSTVQYSVLAVGIESGIIELWGVPIDAGGINAEKSSCELLLCIPRQHCHIATITKLAWRPSRDVDDERRQEARPAEMILASASMDHGCRLFKIEV